MQQSRDWLTVVRGDAPLVVSVPHAGTQLPAPLDSQFVSPWLARKDTDWYVSELYDFAAELGVTTIATAISRSVIDVNRDPSGVSLYPGQTTTELCPTTTFDGEALYHATLAPTAQAVRARLETFFDPYHAALQTEITRLRQRHARVVLYDAHSIRSRAARLFAGELPVFNIGSFLGRSCAAELTESIESLCATSNWSHIVNGRFQGGYITRHYGAPAQGVHAIQMELAGRGYLREPDEPTTSANWPPPYELRDALPMKRHLRKLLLACLAFARDDTRV
ncbi:MAG: N-formylglutamate deformylase [Proteobacteria bacterium]|nr:N-formylglutamate deformylase [Pseudomonadota bacterium]